MKTFASLFTGGGGADCGARMAGLKHLWGVEKNAAYGAIAQLNGFNALVQDVQRTDWNKLKRPNWLHASPPCVNASIANSKGGETPLDIKLAEAVVCAIAHFLPDYFSLENVRDYGRFESFDLITLELARLGYERSWVTLDAAEYGVPQHRDRLWLVASRKHNVSLPWPTHGNKQGQLDWISETALDPFESWDKAIEGKLSKPTAPMSDRMIAKLPSAIYGTHFCCGWEKSRVATRIPQGRPAPTITTTMDRPSKLPWVFTSGLMKEAMIADVSALAALQSFPDDYQWGDSLPAARQAIGNACPPLLVQRIVEEAI